MKRNRETCSADGCDELENCRGLCSSHYMKARRAGALDKIAVRCVGMTCSAEGCDRPARKRGMCSSHYTEAWRKANPEAAARNIRQSWRARAKRDVPGAHTEAEWALMLDMYAHRCAYCLGPAESRDHITPICAGGSNDIENIVPACLTCNKRKQRRPLLLWLAKQRGPA